MEFTLLIILLQLLFSCFLISLLVRSVNRNVRMIKAFRFFKAKFPIEIMRSGSVSAEAVRDAIIALENDLMRISKSKPVYDEPK